MLGLTSALGTLVPFIRFHIDDAGQNYGILLYIGIVASLFGLGFLAVSGKLKEWELANSDDLSNIQETAGKKSYITLGLITSILAGIFSCMLNIGLVYGQDIADEAKLHETPESGKQFARFFFFQNFEYLYIYSIC